MILEIKKKKKVLQKEETQNLTYNDIKAQSKLECSFMNQKVLIIQLVSAAYHYITCSIQLLGTVIFQINLSMEHYHVNH